MNFQKHKKSASLLKLELAILVKQSGDILSF